MTQQPKGYEILVTCSKCWTTVTCRMRIDSYEGDCPVCKVGLSAKLQEVQITE